jgi:GWxTD domain-containing protein
MVSYPSPRHRAARRVVAALAAPLLLLMLATVASAQEPGPLGFAYSYSVFALDDTASVVELTYQYSERGLSYERVDGREIGRLIVGLQVWDSTGRALVESEWITTNARAAKGEEDHALLGVKVFGLRPGRHRARISYRDVADESRTDADTFDLVVRKFLPNRIAISDVQVISEIAPSTDQSNRFYKNGYVIYPNVLSTIEPPFLLLNSYLEIYNAHQIPTSQYDVSYAIADAKGRIFYKQEETRERPTADAIVDVHSTIVEELPSGSYFYIVKVFGGLKRTATDSAMVVRAISIVNTPERDSELLASVRGAGGSNGTTEADPMYAGMTEEELDREFQMLRHIALEQEKGIWSELKGADGKARFLTEFWGRRDPVASTPENELRSEYQKRIETANALYREPLMDHGYQSDRGRILLKYGKPDNIERHYYDKNRRPYEIWHFSKDHLEFAFVDRSNNGRFQLVHSNAPGEVRNESWERLFATIHEYMDN